LAQGSTAKKERSTQQGTIPGNAQQPTLVPRTHCAPGVRMVARVRAARS